VIGSGLAVKACGDEVESDIEDTDRSTVITEGTVPEVNCQVNPQPRDSLRQQKAREQYKIQI
jgi:hypothetical protein